jgi:hypothetical protein
MPPGRPDDDLPGLPPEWAGFVVPDDISELEPEVEAVRRELPPRSRRARLLRIFQTRRFRRYGLSGPLVVAVLLVVLFFASLVFLLLPSAPPSPEAVPLSGSTARPGVPGALVPDVALPVGATGAVRLRNVRPAVLVVVPGGCDCLRLIEDVISSTRAVRLRVLFIGEGREPALPSLAPPARVNAAVDTDGRVAAVYHAAEEPTAIFVQGNGEVTRVIHNVAPGRELHDEVTGIAR